MAFFWLYSSRPKAGAAILVPGVCKIFKLPTGKYPGPSPVTAKYVSTICTSKETISINKFHAIFIAWPVVHGFDQGLNLVLMLAMQGSQHCPTYIPL